MSVSGAKPPLEFTGCFRHGLDESRRAMIPAPWRGRPRDNLYSLLPWPIGEESCIVALPPERWLALKERLKAKSLSNSDAASVERYISSSTVRAQADSVGRLCLPEELLRRTGIQREVVFVGRLDKFELWDPSRLETTVAADRQTAATAFKSMDL